MLVNGLLICLVFMWTSAVSESLGGENKHHVGLQQCRRACRNLGGKCVKRKKSCPDKLPLEKRRGAPFCNRRRRCCYPESSGVKHLDDMETHELWLHILHQLDLPYENRSIYRGENNYVYYLDNEKYTDGSYSPIIIPYIGEFTTLKNRFKNLLNYTQGKKVVPSLFDPDVKKAVNELYQVYLENPGPKGILKVAVNGKDYVNEVIHIHTLMHALVYDSEVEGYTFPAFYDVFPEFFAHDCTTNTGNDCCEIREYLPNLTEEEWKVSYYREDSGYNNFHGSWHVYNPFWQSEKITHGELFYYMHNQIIARYDWERLSNGLDLVKPLDNWNYPISQNYIPPVLTNTLKRCASQSSQVLDFLSIYRNNLEQDIANKYLRTESGETIPIDNDDGIKHVGCALESDRCGGVPIDQNRYWPIGIHNQGHVIISEINCDPPELAEKVGVMSNTMTATRDPIFWQWHKFIDQIFQLQKKNVPEYQVSELVMDGVYVGNIDVSSKEYPEGELHTFNSRRKLTLRRDKNIATCIYQPHINHYSFKYKFEIYNDKESADVNVRIYMAPKQYSTNYAEQRTLWSAMDRFKVTLTNGNNTITRESCDSRITIPPSKSLQELSHIYSNIDSFNDHQSLPDKCQCGLPEHNLIPRGSVEGMAYQLFIYITPRNGGQGQPSYCDDLECSDLCSKDYSKCLHSDGQPMGFPFDRPLKTLDGHSIKTIEDLDNKLPNARLHDINIVYDEDVQIDERQCSN